MLKKILTSALNDFDIHPDDTALNRFETYYNLLDETNKVMNLTAITGEEDTARLHFADCAALLNFVDFSGKSVIDVGCGAGFPSIPLKILMPDINLTMLDSLDKRINFLKKVVEETELPKAYAIHGRAEELSRESEHRERYDIATARAVASLRVLSELCLPFVKPGGVFVSMKGPEPYDEIEESKKAIRELGGEVSAVKDYIIPGTDIKHTAVIIKKISNTKSKYPRKWAQIKKSPI